MLERGVNVDHATLKRWAIDMFGQTLDFMLAERRNEAVATLEGIEVV